MLAAAQHATKPWHHADADVRAPPVVCRANACCDLPAACDPQAGGRLHGMASTEPALLPLSEGPVMHAAAAGPVPRAGLPHQGPGRRAGVPQALLPRLLRARPRPQELHAHLHLPGGQGAPGRSALPESQSRCVMVTRYACAAQGLEASDVRCWRRASGWLLSGALAPGRVLGGSCRARNPHCIRAVELLSLRVPDAVCAPMRMQGMRSQMGLLMPPPLPWAPVAAGACARDTDRMAGRPPRERRRHRPRRRRVREPLTRL